MDIKSILYKNDEFTGEYRLSKTKLITSLVFIVFFLILMSFYLSDPQYTNMNILILVFSAIIGALFFAVPVFVFGWIISRVLYRGSHREPINNQGQYDFNPNSTGNTNNQVPNQNDFGSRCPHDYAVMFKDAIEANDSDMAGELLQTWDKSDANYRYASIIYEGMPPTKFTREELYRLLNEADHMVACDESLKQWYRSTAIQVITLNN